MAHPRRGRMRAALLIVAGACAAGCSFDYAAGGAAAEELLDEVPETELSGATHTVVRNGRVVAEIEARRVRNFPRRGVTELHEVRYTEFDAAGEAVTTGSADFARYRSETGDADVAGAVRLRSESQGVSLQAEALRWEEDARRLSSDSGEAVEVTRDDGSLVQGRGLEVDVRSKTVRFAEPVTGTLVTAEERPATE